MEPTSSIVCSIGRDSKSSLTVAYDVDDGIMRLDCIAKTITRCRQHDGYSPSKGGLLSAL